MKYRAFFSYARIDDRVANWLHAQLDRYRTPRSLIGEAGDLGPVTAKLHPIFRDRTDLESGGHITERLQEALEASETLIVLCTPASASSQWVNHEVETFFRLGREDRIFPVIASGEPDSGNPDTECFPPALRNKGMLAADLREIRKPNGQVVGDGRESGRLKLIAGLLGLPLDRLVQRERRRQRQLIAMLGGAAAAFAAVAIAAGSFWLLANARADEIQKQAGQLRIETANAVSARDKEAIARKDATDREIEARQNLHRFFGATAWIKLGEGDTLAAARYALAGYRLSPANEQLYHSALAAALSRSGEIRKTLRVNGFYLLSRDGTYVETSDDKAKTAQRINIDTGEIKTIAYPLSKDLPATPHRELRAEIARFQTEYWATFFGKRRVAWQEPTSDVWDTYGRVPSILIVDLATAERTHLKPAEGVSLAGCRLQRLSLDEKTLAFSCADNTAKAVDIATGKLVGETPPFEQEPEQVAFLDNHALVALGVKELQFTPVGSLSVSLPKYRVTMVDLNNPATKDEAERQDRTSRARQVDVTTMVYGDSNPGIVGTQVALAPDGRFAAVAALNRIEIVDLEAQMVVGRLAGFSGDPSEIRFSGDASRIAALAPDGAVRVWNMPVASGAASFPSSLPRFSGTLPVSPDFSTNGAVATTPGRDDTEYGRLNVWRVADGARLAAIPGPVDDSCLSPDGSRVVFSGAKPMPDGTFANIADLWDINAGKRLRTLKGEAGVPRDLYPGNCFIPDGSRFIMMEMKLDDGDPTIKGIVNLYNAETGARMARLSNAEGDINSVNLIRGGNVIETRHLPAPLKRRYWATDTGALKPKLEVADTIESPRRLALEIFSDNQFGITDQTTGAVVAMLGKVSEKIEDNRFSISHLDNGRAWFTYGFFKDGKRQRTLELWDLTTRKQIIRKSGPYQYVGVSPDGARVYTVADLSDGEGTRRLEMFTADDGKLAFTKDEPGLGGITGLSFLGPDRLIGTIGMPPLTKVWDATDGSTLGSIDGELLTSYLAGQRRLFLTLSGGLQNTAMLWDAADGRLLMTMQTASRNSISYGIHWIAGGRWIVNSRDPNVDRTAWNIAPFVMPMDELVTQVCATLLSAGAGVFSRDAYDADPLLRSEWTRDRDVCTAPPPAVPVTPAAVKSP